MIKKVTVARALKEKNRLAGRIVRARGLIEKENSHKKENPCKVDIKALSQKAEDLRNRLVSVKTAIAVANRDIVSKILDLAETKSEIAWLNNLNIKEGFHSDDYRYHEKPRICEYVTEINQSEVLARLKDLQKKADDLQDELDEFNANTMVEIEFDD